MEACPRGFLCLDNNTLLLSLSIIFIAIAYITTSKKQEYNKLQDYSDLSKNKKDLLKTYMKTINQNMEISMKKMENPVESGRISPVDLDSELSGRDTNLLIRNNNIYVVPPSSRASVLVNKEYERIVNPLLPPERSYNTTYSVPVNIPTRGETRNYQQVGVITGENGPDGPRILPLYGRPRWPGANKWNFYTGTDQYHSMKLPVYFKRRDCQDDNGCDELYDGDVVNVPQYGEGKDFKVSMYKLDSPQYLPSV